MVLKFWCASESRLEFVKTQTAETHSKEFLIQQIWWGIQILIFLTSSLRPHFEDHWAGFLPPWPPKLSLLKITFCGSKWEMKMLGLWTLLRWDLALYKRSEHFRNSYSCLRQARKSHPLPTLSWALFMTVDHPQNTLLITLNTQPKVTAHHHLWQFSALSPTHFILSLLSSSWLCNPSTVNSSPQCLQQTLLTMTINLERISK